MGMRWMNHFAALVLIAAMPATAQAQDGLGRELRGFADITAGQRTGSATPVDKLLRFDRRDGHVVVTTIAVAPPGEWPDYLPEGGIAVMRTRAAGGQDNLMPPDTDFEFVRRTGRRLFVVGEWTRPAPMWEIIREAGNNVRFRPIGADGTPGQWLTPVIAPEGAR